MSERDQVIEKIKKLLRMKRGGTAAEVETALGLAAELARKHGIDLAAVNPDEQSEERRISHVSEVMKTRLPAEAKYAAAILVNFFDMALQLRREYVKKHWPNSQDQDLDGDDSRAWQSKMAGIRAGERTEIRSGLKGAPKPAAPALPPPAGQLTLI